MSATSFDTAIAPKVIDAAREALKPDQYPHVAAVLFEGTEGSTEGVLSILIDAKLEPAVPAERRAIPVFSVEHAGRAITIEPKVVRWLDEDRTDGKPDATIPDPIDPEPPEKSGLETLRRRWLTSVAPPGLYPGARVFVERPQERKLEVAAVGCLLGRHVGRLSGRPTHLMTCGHCFAQGASRLRVWGVDAPGTAVQIGELKRNFLDGPRGDERFGAIDVAVVELNPEGQRLAAYTAAWLAIAGRIPHAAIDGWSGQIYSPTLDLMTPHKPVYLKFGEFRFSGTDIRAPYSVREGAYIGSRISEDGDSGTLLRAQSDPVLALGVLSGARIGRTVFEPVDRALRTVHYVVDPSLELITEEELRA